MGLVSHPYSKSCSREPAIEFGILVVGETFVITADLLESFDAHCCVMTMVRPVPLGSFPMFCSAVTELGVLSQSRRLLEHSHPLSCHGYNDRISAGSIHFVKEYGTVVVRIMTVSIDPNEVITIATKFCNGEIDPSTLYCLVVMKQDKARIVLHHFCHDVLGTVGASSIHDDDPQAKMFCLHIQFGYKILDEVNFIKTRHDNNGAAKKLLI